MLFGPLGLQSQLIGYLKRLAERQYNLIGQILYRKGERGRAGSPILSQYIYILSQYREQWLYSVFSETAKYIRTQFLSLKLLQKKKNCITRRSDSNLETIVQQQAAPLST